MRVPDMSRRPARFTEADIRRAAKVAKQLGLAVEIAPDGTIRLTAPREDRLTLASARSDDTWDE
jgi:hypothetical protein